MNVKFKKIIAREFLILLAMIVLGLIIFGCVFPYNAYQEKQIDGITQLIEEKEFEIDSLHKPIDQKIEKQRWFFEKVSGEFDISNSAYSELKTLWPILHRIALNDSTEYRWKNKWEKDLVEFHQKIGFKTPQDLEKFQLVDYQFLAD